MRERLPAVGSTSLFLPSCPNRELCRLGDALRQRSDHVGCERSNAEFVGWERSDPEFCCLGALRP